jgi:hypothetical protein
MREKDILEGKEGRERRERPIMKNTQICMKNAKVRLRENAKENKVKTDGKMRENIERNEEVR